MFVFAVFPSGQLPTSSNRILPFNNPQCVLSDNPDPKMIIEMDGPTTIVTDPTKEGGQWGLAWVLRHFQSLLPLDLFMLKHVVSPIYERRIIL